MDELAEIRASVAQALGLEKLESYDGWDIFNANWQVRCRDWLLAQGYCVHFWPEPAEHGVTCYVRTNDKSANIELDCPAAEFPARAIHAITSTQSSSSTAPRTAAWRPPDLAG